MALHRLPTELLDAVFHFVHPKDLASLSRTSSHLLPIAQRLLYRRVTISPTRRNLGVVITLAKRKDLARVVRSFSINVATYPTLFRSFYRHLAIALANMTEVVHLDIFVDADASWVLPGSHESTFPRLLHFASSFSFDSHVAAFLAKAHALLELEVDSISSHTPLMPSLPITSIPHLIHFIGSSQVAQAIMPGRPVESIHLNSGDLTESVVNCLAESTAKVTVLGASTSSLPVPLLMHISERLPHLVYLRMATTHSFSEAPDVVSFSSHSALRYVPDRQCRCSMKTYPGH